MWPKLRPELGSVVTARSKEAIWDSIRPKAFPHRSLGHRPRCQMYHCISWPKAIFTLKLDDQIRPRVHGYLATVIRDLDSPGVVVGGVEDHVHILFDIAML